MLSKIVFKQPSEISVQESEDRGRESEVIVFSASHPRKTLLLRLPMCKKKLALFLKIKDKKVHTKCWGEKEYIKIFEEKNPLVSRTFAFSLHSGFSRDKQDKGKGFLEIHKNSQKF